MGEESAKTTKKSTSNYSTNTLENLFKINWNSMEPTKELEKAIENKFLTPQQRGQALAEIITDLEIYSIKGILN